MRGFRQWRWHLDEMYVKLNGEMVYLWRAVDHESEVHFSATAMHDWRLTQRLVLGPEFEVDAAMQDVPELGIGAGIEKLDLSGRLRYEIERNLAPYVGVSWERRLGGSADFSRADRESISTVSFVAGLRFWF